MTIFTYLVELYPFEVFHYLFFHLHANFKIDVIFFWSVHLVTPSHNIKWRQSEKSNENVRETISIPWKTYRLCITCNDQSIGNNITSVPGLVYRSRCRAKSIANIHFELMALVIEKPLTWIVFIIVLHDVWVFTRT